MVEPHDPAVQSYDFRHPLRITAKVRERLGADQATLARTFAEGLGERLGIGCDVATSGLAEANSDRLFETAFDPVFALAPLSSGAPVLFQFQATLAQAFVDRLLGGMGASREVSREATDVEVGLLGFVTAKIGDAVRRVWSAALPAAAAPVYMSASERHVLEVQAGVAATFEVKTADAAGHVQLFLSHDAVSRALALDGASRADGNAKAKLTLEHVEAVRVPLRARWPATSIQLRELAALRVGDVVHLDHKVGEELEILLGDRVAFRGHPGIVEEAFGIQVTRPA